MEASLLMPCEDVPDNDGLRVILSVHQWAESDQVSAREEDHLVQHLLWCESHSYSTHYRGSQTQVQSCQGVWNQPVPKYHDPQEWCLIFLSWGWGEHNQVQSNHRPLQVTQNGVPIRSGTRKSNTPTKVCLSRLV